MSSSSFAGVKRTALSFKGEGGKEKKKRRTKVENEEPVDAEGQVRAAATESDVPVVPGSGRIVTNTTTVHGFETKFKDELEVGDTIMVHHPTSLEVELRMVVSVLSQRSSVLHQAFSKAAVWPGSRTQVLRRQVSCLDTERDRGRERERKRERERETHTD
ncbi:unnamed protein product [Durusdinium trenchii]|uniref:Uncharacterized protein n=1 Tax=Durusdinium trenchii TaxID=1381693 RepID=A0ABP0QZG8_9DINO